jgi:acyl dehydratase
VDEPTSRLDEANAAAVARLLAAAAERERQTVICATHDPQVIRYADVVIALGDGPVSPDMNAAAKVPSMTTSETSGLVTDIAGLAEHVGTHIGYTDWQEMTQERVNQFADATDDHQYIHVDPERAKQTPFGGTIAHGYLTLSLVAPIIGRLLEVSDAKMGVNYGLDKVRFPAPLPVGAQWRGGLELVEAKEIPGGVQGKLLATVEVKGTEKPAMVAECLVRMYG